jgi:hypothetical protein
MIRKPSEQSTNENGRDVIAGFLVSMRSEPSGGYILELQDDDDGPQVQVRVPKSLAKKGFKVGNIVIVSGKLNTNNNGKQWLVAEKIQATNEEGLSDKDVTDWQTMNKENEKRPKVDKDVLILKGIKIKRGEMQSSFLEMQNKLKNRKGD